MATRHDVNTKSRKRGIGFHGLDLIRRHKKHNKFFLTNYLDFSENGVYFSYRTQTMN